MALFGRKNANKNNDKPGDEEKRIPAVPETPETAAEPEEVKQTPADEPAAEPFRIEPAAEELPSAEPEPEKPQEPREQKADRPAPEPFIPLNGSVAAPSSRAPSGDKPRYHTPEGFQFNRYFLAERRIQLENVSYESQRALSNQLHLNIRDTIVAQLLSGGVKVTYNRTLAFEPEGPFTLSVSFSVMLVFNPGTRGEVDWKTIDVAEEFKKNCPNLVSAMNAKIGLLIAEITNANGTPIFPPVIR